MIPAPDDLLGVWRLVSCEQRFQSGELQLPFGDDPIGYLVYTAEGFMVVDFMTRERPPGMSSDAERLAALDSYHSYGGRFSYSEGVVTHHVEFGLLPSDVGSHKQRRVDLRAD